MKEDGMSKYQFTDTDLAARRLETVARVFGKSSQEFICKFSKTAPLLALDLGCGPGSSTHVVAAVIGAERTVGLDSSEKFVALAKQNRSDGFAFHMHDITSSPFPVGPADFVFSRLLLCHLEDSASAISIWADQMQMEGLLLLEDVDSIQTTVETFTSYLGIVD